MKNGEIIGFSRFVDKKGVDRLYVDVVSAPTDNKIYIVDDDGFAKGKPLNVIASAFYQGDIVGDVLFVPEKSGDFVNFIDIEAQCKFMKLLL